MPDEIHIPCPECGSVLRLRDRNLLGRMGKCPNCSHRFLLEEPSPKKDSARPDWMKSESDSTTQLAPPPAKAKRVRKKPDKKQSSVTPPVSENISPNKFVGINSLETSSSEGNAGVGRLQNLKTRQKKQRKITFIAGGIIAVLVGAFTLWMMHKPEEPYKTTKKIKVNKKWQEHKEGLKKQTEVAKSSRPTQGKPISLAYLPEGCRLLINVHPAVFWEKDSKGEEFRYCFGESINEWLAAKIKEFCKYQPQEIEEVLFGAVLESRGSTPEFTAVVHLKKKQNKQEMIKMFGVERSPDYTEYPVYVDGARSFVLIDLQTFISVPTKFANETIQILSQGAGDKEDSLPTPSSTIGIEELLKQTDRQRHFTLVMEAADAAIHQETLIPKSLFPVWDEFLLWLGKDVETFSWSFHLGDDLFDSEILLRNQFIRKPALLHKDFRTKVDTLPRRVLNAVKKMNPQLAGPRKVIGRFPAMLKAFSMATKGGTGKRYIQLTTRLPERAAPNLAIGTVLAWNESTRTNFSPPPKVTPPTSSGSQLPITVIGRLRMKIDIDFRRQPLQEAFAYIAEETKTKMVVDGDGLKLSGFTKNMPQTFTMGEVPATHAIAKILSQRGYELMRVIVDEKNKQVILTTKAVVEETKATAFDFAAEVKKQP
ncbi:hypothetical protein MNBD_PLANCTO02-3308 [hydrothermal vent metagenome]|uniref:Uncharacterized protein n=1 Tax=hydrothermal vent metagenome TaxID=652676 RepID=A0A3B1DPV6_9ZZZZ